MHRARLLGPRHRRREFPDRGQGAIIFSRPRRRRRDFSHQGGEGATFQNIAETARPIINSSRARRRRSDFPDEGGDGATFQITAERAETKRISRPRWRRRNSSDQDGDGATFQTKTEAETARCKLYASLSISRWMQQNKYLLKLRRFFLLPNATTIFWHRFNLFG